MCILIAISELICYCLIFAFDHVPFLFHDSALQTITWTLSRLPIYVAGMALPYYAQRNDVRFSIGGILSVSALAVAVLLGLRIYGLHYHLEPVLYLFMPGSILLIPVVISGGILLERYVRCIPRLFLNGIRFCGLYSLEIYLVHEAILKASPFLPRYVLSPIPAKFICVAISLTMAWLLNILCLRILAFISAPPHKS